MLDMFTSASDVPSDEHSGAATPVIAGDDTATPLGATMPLHANPLLPGDTCMCGALVDHGRTVCRKCTARNRWATRHHNRRRAGRSGLRAHGRHQPAITTEPIDTEPIDTEDGAL
jgi:hypothetical protein